ncbi:MAG: DUF4367 domain-containing protein [Lachnospiraceae bacterium]|nr:DUF4367 domain-containing protein [Lachnospiraceae bacterium]
MTDEQIREVLLSTQDYMLSFLPKTEWGHEFSKKYIKNKKSLIGRDKHPVQYWMRRVAVFILLTLCLSGGLILSFNKEIRAEVLKWIVEQFGDNAYKYQSNIGENIEVSSYSLEGIISKDYKRVDRLEGENSVDEIYVNEKGVLLIFVVKSSASEQEFYVVSDKDMKPYEIVSVNGNSAELYLSDSQEESNMIVWRNKNDVLFSIKGIMEREELIKLAESIE